MKNIGPIIATLFLALIALGCPAPKTPATARADARAAVLMASNALATADKTCATIASAKENAALATQCANVYKVARASLVTAADAVDAWDSVSGAQMTVTCAVIDVSRQLGTLATTISAASGGTIKEVDDLLSFAGTLGMCSDPAGGVVQTPTSKDGG